MMGIADFPIVCVGNSTTYGIGVDGTSNNPADEMALHFPQSWPSALRKRLASVYGDTGYGGFAPDATFITSGGGASTSTNAPSLLRHNRLLNSSSKTLTFTVPAGHTRVVVTQANLPGDTSATWSRAGTGQGAIATLTGTEVPIRTTLTVAAGEQIVISGPASGQTYITAVSLRTGTTGAVVHRVGQPGYTTGDIFGGLTSAGTGTLQLSSGLTGGPAGMSFQERAARAHWRSFIPVGGPGLLILSMRINDQTQQAGAASIFSGVTIDKFTTWNQSLANWATADGVDVLFLGEPRSVNANYGAGVPTENEYNAALKAIAASTPHVAHADLGDLFGTPGTTAEATAYQAAMEAAGLNVANSVHMKGAGYAEWGRYAHRVLDSIVPVGV
jgi:hypothetical protein